MIRQLVSFATITSSALVLGATISAPAEATHRHPQPSSISVTGAVATPITYTSRDIADLPQVSLPDLRNPRHTGRLVTGASLQSLVAASAPTLPAVKNAQLRVTVTVSRRDGSAVAIALGELDANGGNHPALLVARRAERHQRKSVDLVIPGDLGYRRTVNDVDRIQVRVAAPALPSGVPTGALRITDGRRSTTLSAAQLGRLPVVTRTVAFQSGSGPQIHVESGPTLAAVLRAARIKTSPSTTVAAIADDGYVATVTPAEATSGRRPLLLATAEDGVPLDQPRLVTDGDVFGGRYVSGVLGLEVSAARICR